MFDALIYSVLLTSPKEAPSPSGWPSALIAYRMYEWFPLFLITVLMEVAIIRRIASSGWIESMKAVGVANFVSLLIGILMLPLAGVAWKYALMHMFESLWGIYGNYSLASWMGNLFFMALYLGLVEVMLLARLLDNQVTLKFVSGWVCVNMLTILLAIATFFIKPPEIGIL